jgi:hypothetical protein
MINLDSKLPIGKQQGEIAIKDELSKLQETLPLLDKKFVEAMNRSMRLFKEHVSQAHHIVLVDFILPFPFKGLSY